MGNAFAEGIKSKPAAQATDLQQRQATFQQLGSEAWEKIKNGQRVLVFLDNDVNSKRYGQMYTPICEKTEKGKIVVSFMGCESVTAADVKAFNSSPQFAGKATLSKGDNGALVLKLENTQTTALFLLDLSGSMAPKMDDFLAVVKKTSDDAGAPMIERATRAIIGYKTDESVPDEFKERVKGAKYKGLEIGSTQPMSAITQGISALAEMYTSELGLDKKEERDKMLSQVKDWEQFGWEGSAPSQFSYTKCGTYSKDGKDYLVVLYDENDKQKMHVLPISEKTTEWLLKFQGILDMVGEDKDPIYNNPTAILKGTDEYKCYQAMLVINRKSREITGSNVLDLQIQRKKGDLYNEDFFKQMGPYTNIVEKFEAPSISKPKPYIPSAKEYSPKSEVQRIYYPALSVTKEYETVTPLLDEKKRFSIFNAISGQPMLSLEGGPNPHSCDAYGRAHGPVNRVVAGKGSKGGTTVPTQSIGVSSFLVDAAPQQVERGNVIEFRLPEADWGLYALSAGKTKYNIDKGHYSQATDLRYIKESVLKQVKGKQESGDGSIMVDGKPVDFAYTRDGSRLDVTISPKKGLSLTIGFMADGSKAQKDEATARVNVSGMQDMTTDIVERLGIRKLKGMGGLRSIDIGGQKYIYDEQNEGKKTGQVYTFNSSRSNRTFTVNAASAAEYADQGAIVPKAVNGSQQKQYAAFEKTEEAITTPALDANGTFTLAPAGQKR